MAAACACICISASCAKPRPTPSVTQPARLQATWTWRPIDSYVVQIDDGAPVRFRALARCDPVTAVCTYPFAVYDAHEHLFRVWEARGLSEGPKSEVRFSAAGGSTATGPSNPANLRLIEVRGEQP